MKAFELHLQVFSVWPRGQHLNWNLFRNSTLWIGVSVPFSLVLGFDGLHWPDVNSIAFRSFFIRIHAGTMWNAYELFRHFCTSDRQVCSFLFPYRHPYPCRNVRFSLTHWLELGVCVSGMHLVVHCCGNEIVLARKRIQMLWQQFRNVRSANLHTLLHWMWRIHILTSIGKTKKSREKNFVRHVANTSGLSYFVLPISCPNSKHFNFATSSSSHVLFFHHDHFIEK